MRAAWVLAAGLAVAAAPANAVVVTTGAGSAVAAAEASAAFESHDSLWVNPYLESGLRFQRVGLTNNNNGCGFAGCGYPYFTGNYFFGATPGAGLGGGGYLSIFSDALLFADQIIRGVEFVAGSGVGEPIHYAWAAYLGGALVGEGVGETVGGTVLGFQDAGGFTRLHWTATNVPGVTFDTSLNAPAIDDVRVRYSALETAVPAPGMAGMLGLAALGLAGVRRRGAGLTA